MTIQAKVIKDSISPAGDRLTTLEIEFPRFILAEFNTHRVFSRNSASSRAIPVAKQLQRVLDDPWLPCVWRYNQPGMQAAEDMSEEDIAEAKRLILELRDKAVETVTALNALGGKGLHKQWANRFIEPWQYHTVICTSTEWENFFIQRASELAQPEICETAYAMIDAFNNSQPIEIEYDQWHTPYVDPQMYAPTHGIQRPVWTKLDLAVSAARCARVSYMTHDGEIDRTKDIALYKRLVTAEPKHWSPLEHVATPVKPTRWYSPWRKSPLGNLEGWAQLRHLPEWQ